MSARAAPPRTRYRRLVRRKGGSADVVPVEMLDDDSPSGDGDAWVAPPNGSDDRVRGRRGFTVVGIAILLVLGVTVAVLNVAEARQATALRAALADAPGFLSPLGDGLTRLWSTPDTRPLVAVGDLILLEHGGLEAVDSVSGEVRWSRPMPRAGLNDCLAADLADAPDVFICVGPAIAAVGRGQASVIARVLDASTGAELLHLRQPGVLVDARVLGDDAVSVLYQNDGTLVVIRWDLASGADVWRYQSPAPIGSGDIAELQFLYWGTRELGLGAGQWLMIDLESGLETTQVVDPGALHWTESVPLAGGSAATWRAGFDYVPSGVGPGAEPFTGAVLGPDGGRRFDLPAPAWQSALDDGSVPGVLLLVTSRPTPELQGVDSVTGEPLWTADSLVVQEPLARIDGVALVRDGSAVIAIRISDGRELWRIVTEQVHGYQALTDGELVLLVRRDDAGKFIAAHRLGDGIEVWREALPAGLVLTPLVGRLLVVGSDVTAMG